MIDQKDIGPVDSEVQATDKPVKPVESADIYKSDSTAEPPQIKEVEGSKVVKENTLYLWNAPARPFKRRNREFYITVIIMAAIVGMVLFFAEGAMPVVLLVALIFLFYVLSTVEPDVIEYSVTNKGIKVAGRLTEWEIIKQYWFMKRLDSTVLVLGLTRIPGRLELVTNEEDVPRVREAIADRVTEEKIPPGGLDKVATWISAMIPGNR